MTRDDFLDELVEAVLNKRSVVFIASHPLYLERRKQELLERTGGYANVRWYLWGQWVDHLLHAQGLSYVRVTQSVRQEIVESLLHHHAEKGMIPDLEKGLQHPGMSKSVALWIEDLTKEVVPNWEPAFVEAQDQVLQELHELAGAYFGWTREQATPFKEAMQLEDIACEMLSHVAGSPFAEGETAFFLEGELGHTASKRGLLAALHKRKPDLILHIPPSPLALTVPMLPARWYSLSSPKEEVRAAVQDVKRALQHGSPMDEVALVVPSEDYRRFVARESRAQGVPVRNPEPISLIHRDAVQRVLRLLQLKLSNWSREALLAAANRHAAVIGISESSLAWGKDIIRQSGVQESQEAWRGLFLANWGRASRRLDFLREHGAEESDAEVLRVQQRMVSAGQWLRLIKRFSRILDSLPENGRWPDYLSAVRKWVKPSEPEDVPVCETLRHLLRVREDIALSFSYEGGSPISLQSFSLWLLKKARSTPIDSPHGEGVAVCLPEEAYGGRFSFLHVLGLAEGVFPSVYAPHWIWERAGLASLVSHEREAALLLQKVMGTATKALFLYTPQTAGRKQPVVPARDVTRILGEPETRRAESQRPNKSLREEERAPAEAVVLHQAEQILHVTGLDLYRRCAFRYFADRVLHVKSRTERTSGLIPMDIGNVMHAVLRRWLEAGGAQAEHPVELAESLLVEELDEVAQRWHLSGLIWKSQRERVRQDLLRFVAYEVSQIAQRGQESIGEWGFGIVHEEKMADTSTREPLLLEQGGRTLRLCGIVDRVDKGEAGFSVHDYKLSKCPTAQEIEEGAALQVALYLLAYHRLTGTTPIRGRYALLKQPGGGQELDFRGGEGSFATFSSRVEHQVFSLLDQMESGDVTPRPWKVSECQNCSYQYACRHAEAQSARREYG